MRVLSALVAAIAMAASMGASAATFEVLSAGAVEPGLLPAAEAFRRQTGHEARIRFATAPALRQRVGGGEAVDVVIAPPAVLDDLAKTGRVDGAARVVVGKVGVGVAVRDGAPQPDVRTPEALKRAILGAELSSTTGPRPGFTWRPFSSASASRRRSPRARRATRTAPR